MAARDAADLGISLGLGAGVGGSNLDGGGHSNGVRVRVVGVLAEGKAGRIRTVAHLVYKLVIWKMETCD